MSLKKIVFTGPESTGKTTLAKHCAKVFNTTWNPEFARFYLSKANGAYDQEDITHIARGQLQWEAVWSHHAHRFLFCDTALIVPKVWSIYKYGNVSLPIESMLKENKYDHFFLCGIDLPWHYDPLREHPSLMHRQELFNLYQSILLDLQVPFTTLSGSLSARCQKAVEHIKKMD